MDKLLMTIKEASQALALSERSIFWLITTGQIESRKIGRRRLLPREAIERFATRDHGRIRPKLKSKAAGVDRGIGGER